MIEQLYQDVYDDRLAEGAILNERMEGFKEDYLLLHILLRKYGAKTCFEVGTHTGWGTKIIKNALGEDSVVFSLDLPDEDHNISKQHPLSEGKKGVGYECDLPFIQFRGDSRKVNYAQYKSEAYWVDGEHTTENVQHETEQIMVRCFPKLVLWHDTDMPEVMEGILSAIERNEIISDEYDFYRVVDTRITYAKRKDI